MAISKKSFVNLDLQGNALVNPTIGLNSNMTKGGSFQYNDAELRLEYFNGSLVEQVANLSDISAVTGGLILQGAYDAANNNPNITDGSALKGYFWVVNVAGTFLGETVQVGDSIIAKVDEAGALLTDWLILQGNVVIATTEVAGITYLATQEQVNGGTETGAYAVTPATLQGKLDPINTDITNLENDKLARDGSQAMTGDLNIGGNDISNASMINAQGLQSSRLEGLLLNSNIDANNASTIVNLPAPTNNGDAANKFYVDGRIAATRYIQDFYAIDWVPENDYYKVTITHNLNTLYPVVQVLEISGMVVEMSTQANDPNTVIIYSNFIPVDADNGYVVTIVK